MYSLEVRFQDWWTLVWGGKIEILAGLLNKDSFGEEGFRLSIWKENGLVDTNFYFKSRETLYEKVTKLAEEKKNVDY